jgi:hypothetical protein
VGRVLAEEDGCDDWVMHSYTCSMPIGHHLPDPVY